LSNQEQKWFNWTQVVLEEGHSEGMGAGVADEILVSCRVVRPLHVPLVICPVHRTYVVIVR